MRQTPEEDHLIREALPRVSQTQIVLLDHGARHQTASVFESLFGSAPAMIVADANTFAAAGSDVLRSFSEIGHACSDPLVFDDVRLHAESGRVQTIETALRKRNAIAVAVGSGTINDLTKLASHLVGRPYSVVTTAASMDGYAAFGASITHCGSKQTFPCAAPSGILADLEVIEAAPLGMNASGYADLLAKTAAGADWIVADALGVDPMNATSWQMIHNQLDSWLEDPDGIRRGSSKAIRRLTVGLIMSGFAMQHAGTSRPASGAEHQFSHLWDMQRPTDQLDPPSHGFQVGVGTLASAALYEQLLPQDLTKLDVEVLSANWPGISTVEEHIRRGFENPAIREKALEETRAKHVSPIQLRDQLTRLGTVWPELSIRLKSHLMARAEILDRLTAAGCPTKPQQIGIPPEQLRRSHFLAYHIRRRFTILDLLVRTGLMHSTLRASTPSES
jgi:glycerol-1-phosphate dehydrogenase [NAD(P)+]